MITKSQFESHELITAAATADPVTFNPIAIAQLFADLSSLAGPFLNELQDLQRNGVNIQAVLAFVLSATPQFVKIVQDIQAMFAAVPSPKLGMAQSVPWNLIIQAVIQTILKVL